MKKLQIDNVIYEANVDFRNIIECNRISNDNTITDIERALAIIYLVFGETALNNTNHHEKLLKWLNNYLTNGEEIKNDEEPDMDFIKDMDYIEASFMSDYGMDLSSTNMEWKKFINLINGLSNSELGNCCVLNRIRNLRNFDPSTIKDDKERKKIIEAQKRVALDKKENHLTKEQEESMNFLNKIIGI